MDVLKGRSARILAPIALLAGAGFATSVGADSIGDMFKEGKASGQIRAYSISRGVDDSRGNNPDYTRKATAIGGHLKFQTAQLNGFNLGAAGYTTNGLFLPSDRGTYTKVDPTLLGTNNESYSILGEAYVQYKSGATTFKAGRQTIKTPLAGTDDARMLPNLFEAYLLTNGDIENTTLIAAHIAKFAQGTFGRAYNADALAATGGYSADNTRDGGNVGKFVNMGEYAVGTNTNGVTAGAVIYSGIKGVKLQAWDFYAHDLLNAIYLQADYSTKLDNGYTLYGVAQLLTQSDVGDKILGKVDGQLMGVKAGVKIDNLNIFAAYSTTDENLDARYNGSIITPWGGMPAFTQGMVTRHMNFAGTDAWKIAAIYDWKSKGVNLKTVAYYLNHEVSRNNGIGALDGTAWDAKEAGADFIYYPSGVKNLQLRFRANFARDFVGNATGGLDWNEYRLIANYNF